jgi:hypothetical protein
MPLHRLDQPQRVADGGNDLVPRVGEQPSEALAEQHTILVPSRSYRRSNVRAGSSDLLGALRHDAVVDLPDLVHFTQDCWVVGRHEARGSVVRRLSQELEDGSCRPAILV